MRGLLIALTLLMSHVVFASEPPQNYPLVNGLIRKIDTFTNRVSVKHDVIPNLNMPGMTMSFVVADPSQLNGLNPGDKIRFVADEVDGELTILWLEKAPPPVVGKSNIYCKGIAATAPTTAVEIEIRPIRFSTIRYEFAEGSLKGTAYINSIGYMKLHKRGGFYIYRAGTGKLDSKLFFKIKNNLISDAFFYNYNAGMNRSPVKCSWEN